MATLTRAELLAYPGVTLTERFAAEFAEHAEGSDPSRRAPTLRPKRLGPSAATAPLPPVIDISRVPGRDRVERVMHHLRASVPFADRWSEEGLREVAARLVATARVVE